ncbi:MULTISPECIES: SIR2 family protein [unclassified Nocardioides]|uniref:SIR2 family protein n=1 Tax=unclassified Nocardioides TaxID=2615069 RepID=UPI0006FDD7CD|nr:MULTISPECIES: SIR2 family protein [unclassified Nocardioides]KRA30029.1 hypothetical protein ASD81_20280 [Nocardioides sp. Root614]KRA86949.1 hypothetical protein ASD84_22495 [Nocardioides sp. Root682]
MPLEDVAQVVGALGSDFSDFSDAFTSGQYAFWVGSAISRDVVPDLKVLMERVLEVLRGTIDPSNAACPFREALEEVLEVAGITKAVRATVDFNEPVNAWAAAESIVQSVINKYSDVLNIYPSGQAEDFLVWTGLDVPNTYGDPTLEPDAEHYSIAILMLEGIAPSVQTTNWDGLIEAALQALTPEPDNILKVVVTAEDLRKPTRRSELVKFHGCSVRARDDENTYRPLLIARTVQISGWTTQHALMKDQLQLIYSTMPALLVGLSAQDANIHTVFHQAIQNLNRSWPSSPPAVVFANQRLDYHHKHVLQVTYGGDLASNDAAIKAASLLGAYAKPALAGLVLFSLADKLRAVLWQVPELDVGEIAALESDLMSLRDTIAAAAGSDERTFIEAVIGAVRLGSFMFRKGKLPPGFVPYEPISPRPIGEAIQEIDFPKEALGRVALALALLSRACTKEGWKLSPGTCTDPGSGVLTVITSTGTSKVFLVHDAREEATFRAAGYADADPGSTVLILANSEPPRSTRSPRPRFGRTGRTEMRRMSMEDLAKTTSTADELFEAFTLQGAF